MNIVIPMAGLGSRFLDSGITIPKPLIKVNGKSLIEHSIETIDIPGRYIYITKEYEDPEHNLQLTEIFKKLTPDFVEIRVSGHQHGTAHSALAAKEYINNEEELILTNCDQRLEWDPKDFLAISRKDGIDGSILVHDSDSHKHSYAVSVDGFVSHLVEKNPISNDALVGLHFWKHGKDFVSSAEDLVEKSIVSGNEAYISLTYNSLISNGKKIVTHRIPANEYVCLGTPRDLEIYEAKVSEYYSEKPKTIFVDLDGTILKHAHHSQGNTIATPELLPGVMKKFLEWGSLGHKIILTSARREQNRQKIESELQELGIHWDFLLLGITSGQRFLINDKLNTLDQDRAASINVITDSGFNNIDWNTYGL